MFSDEVVRFGDGSAIRQDPETLELQIDPGVATQVMTEANAAAASSLDAALAWCRQDVAGVSVAQRSAALKLAYESRLGDESVWLLRPDPIGCVPSDGDRMFAAQLEQRVRELDEAIASGTLDDATQGAKRRIVLAELAAAGLLQQPLLARKADVLDELGCPALAARARAAAALLDYYASPERAQFVRAPAPASVLDGVLSLDWPRSVEAPADVVPYRLWCNCEDSFRKMAPTGSGTMWMNLGSFAIAMHHRVEDGVRTVLHAASVKRR